MNDPKKYLMNSIVVLLAIETLEYHDKNWLMADSEKLSEEKRKLLVEMIDVLEKYKLD